MLVEKFNRGIQTYAMELKNPWGFLIRLSAEPTPGSTYGSVDGSFPLYRRSKNLCIEYRIVVIQCVESNNNNATTATVLAEASKEGAFIISKSNISFKTLDGILREGILAM
jgi:predicted secreted protein